MKSENLGAFYKYINKRTSYRPAIGALTDDGGNIKTDNYDKAELFVSLHMKRYHMSAFTYGEKRQ